MADLRKQFLKSFDDLHGIFTDVAEKGLISVEEIKLYNKAQKSLVDYVKFLEQEYDPAVNLPFISEEFAKIWQEYKRMRRKKFHISYDTIAEKRSLKDIYETSGKDEKTAIEMIHNAIICQYRRVFPVPENKKVKTTTKKQTITNEDLKVEL